MEIKDILNKLGLDLSNPEVKRAAIEAIDAIMNSRAPMPAGGDFEGGNTNETEVELDPDLLQPSIKQQPSAGRDDDIEIEDEENILDQIKHKESEDQPENKDSSAEQNSSKADSDTQSDQNNSETNQDKGEKTEPKPPVEDKEETPDFDDEINDEVNNISDSINADSEAEDDESQSLVDGEESEDSEESDFEYEFDFDDETLFDDAEDGDDSDSDFSKDSAELEDEDGDADESDEEEFDDEFEFDEDDLIDDTLSNTAEDEGVKAKHEARKLKRERTLSAAKKALADARAKNVSKAIINELEKSIEALEALTEAISKSIKDISDEEFNMLINRALDAIDACGNSGLTYKSEDEREAQVKEIKADLAKAETQNELSAEDIAKIRAETQMIKARAKEADKYKERPANSFKGFQEFLQSLYKAIALQVSTEENRDDSWSAINRRYGGTGILQPGKKIQELPDKRIPIIDFYFDQSGSWDEDDIIIGEKAVQSLADMEAKGQIKVNVYYFANNVFSDAASARRQGGTYAWNDIVKNVIATKANNVVIMTDWDMENHWHPSSQPPLKYTVPGYVWYLWKNGENAPRLPRDLNGRGGVQQFSFNANDI